MASIIVNYTKCLAKVGWKCESGQFKQCTRNAKQGHNLCGIHLLKNPHGLVVDHALEALEAHGQEPQLSAWALLKQEPNLEPHRAPEAHEEEPQPSAWALLEQEPEPNLEEVKEEEGQASEEEGQASEEEGQVSEEEGQASVEEGQASGEELVSISSTSDHRPPLKKVKQELRVKQEDFLEQKTGVQHEFNFEHIADHIQKAHSKSSDFNLSQLKKYSDFCVQFPSAMAPEHWKPFVDTRVGPISVEEEMVKTFLVNLRFCGEATSAKVLPQGSVKQLVTIFFALQAAVRENVFEDPPLWSQGQSKSVALLFREWKREDINKEVPSVRKAVVTPKQIEDWCVHTIMKDMVGEASLIEIQQALLLRLQSGRSHRFVNISMLRVGDTGYKAAAQGSANVPFFNITNTKPTGTLTMEGLAKAKGKVELLIVDPVTLHLWNKWVNQPGNDCWTPETFFFPRQGAADFKWDEPLPRFQHNKAVQECALWLGIPTTAEEVQHFTSKSVRAGVSCDVSRAVRSVLVGSNQKQGRAVNSKVDLGVYTPKDVLMEPGPIFANTHDIQVKLEEAISSHFDPLKQQLCCAACGFPACECKECTKPAGQKKRYGHTCWLRGRSGRVPLTGPVESEFQRAERVTAWQNFCIDGSPEWVDGEYKW